METQLQLLLDKTAVIKLRQEALRSDDTFNIFRILRAGHEEVMLHSRFLYELLNPKGSHGMGEAFLRLFAGVCELPAISFDTVQVMREHANIDILIQDNSRAIVIENKIYAGDQPEQLKRYFEYTKSSFRQPTLIYLTLHGDAPSVQSVGDISEKPRLISYKNEITDWITACMKEAALKPALRETLFQYKALIGQLTNTTMNEVEKQNILDLIAQGDNAEQAAIIARNWNHVRWHTEWDFWTELASLTEIRFPLLVSTFTDEAIDKLVHGGNNKNYYYGIEFSIGELFGNAVIFKFERGDEPMYYGLLHCSADEAIKERMRSCIQYLSIGATEWWAAFRNTKAGIDFYNFDTPTTLQLANPSKRQKIVGGLWQEVQVFISKSCEALQQEFGMDFIPINTAE